MAVLVCPNCKTPFSPAQVNLALGVASCERCGVVHDLSARQSAAMERSSPDPSGIEVLDKAVRYPWRSIVLLFLIFWCTIWDGAMLAIVASALASGSFDMLLFCSLHILAGAGVTYYTLALALNRTEIRIDGADLSVDHGPLPWPGDRALDRAVIRQIYVVEDRGSKGSRSYSVHAQIAPGHPVRLVGGLSVGRARFLEEWIEGQLGILDAPVSGEHR